MIAHVGPFPVEETVGAFGPFLLMAITAGLVTVKARVRRWRQPHQQEVRNVETSDHFGGH